MTSDPAFVETSSHALFEAAQSKTQTPAIRQHKPDMSLADSYAVQASLIEREIAAGAQQIGWKVGFSARPVMAMLGMSEPVCGVLLDRHIHAPSASIPRGTFTAPRLECEIAFVMAQDLSGADCSAADVAAATAYVSPALEIVDTRVLAKDPASGIGPTALDMVADNVACGGIVLSEAQHDVSAFDLRRVGVIASLNGEVEETGLGASVHGDPSAAVAWLVRTLAARGEGLTAGQTVLSGSLMRHFACPSGSKVEADFGEFGALNLTFE